MLPVTDFPVFLGGALAGTCGLVLLLGLIVGQAYDERMLWWHSASIAAALSALAAPEVGPMALTVMWSLQLALAAQTMLKAAGSTGAMHQPAKIIRYLAIAILGLILVATILGLLRSNHPGLLALPWAGLTAWYLIRAWAQNRPWIFWVAGGYAALMAHYLLLELALTSVAQASTLRLASLAALATYAVAGYLGMVWASRLRSENTLRVEARERTDPLTGLATPVVFFDRSDGALMRSRQLGYTCTLFLIRVENIDKIVAERHLDNSESVILAAARAIAGTLRTQDTAARLGHNRFAVIAEAIAEGTSRLMATQILAHGLRAEECGLQGSELHFQIALVEIDPSDATTSDVLSRLDHALQDMAGHTGASHIRPLPRIRRGKHLPGMADLAV
ncbi:MAG: diguanylate cyclase [Pseudomonadota bacterium]